MRRAAAFFGLVALAVSAAAQPTLPFTTSSLQAPSAILTGALTTFEQSSPASSTLHFFLTARNVRLETDIQQGADVGAVAYPVGDPSTQTDPVGPSSWDGATTGDANAFLAATNATIHVIGGTKVTIPTQACLAQATYFDSPRPPLCPSLSSSLAAHVVAPHAEVQGDFELILWQWDGAFASATRNGTYWSGQHQALPTPGVAAGPIEDRRAILFVEGGLLRIDLVADGVDAFVGPSTLASATTIRMAPGGGGPATVTQLPSVQIRRNGDRISGEILAGTPLDAKGHAYALPASPNWWPWLGLGAGLVATSGSYAFARRTSASRHLALSHENFAIGNYQAAARHAAAAIRVPALRREAGVLGTIAHLRARRPDQARRFLESIGKNGPETAARLYLEAWILKEEGKDVESRQLLQECLRIQPRFAMEVERWSLHGHGVYP